MSKHKKLGLYNPELVRAAGETLDGLKQLQAVIEREAERTSKGRQKNNCRLWADRLEDICLVLGRELERNENIVPAILSDHLRSAVTVARRAGLALAFVGGVTDGVEVVQRAAGEALRYIIEDDGSAVPHDLEGTGDVRIVGTGTIGTTQAETIVRPKTLDLKATVGEPQIVELDSIPADVREPGGFGTQPFGTSPFGGTDPTDTADETEEAP